MKSYITKEYNKNLLYGWNKINYDKNIILFNELKQAIKIESNKKIECYSNKNTLLLHCKNNINNNRYFINSQDYNKNEICSLKENEKETIINQKHLFSHRYSAQIKRNFINFKNKINNNNNKSNSKLINIKEVNKDINDNSNIVKTCENEKNMNKNIKTKFKSYRMKYSISSEIGDSLSKIKNLNDKESINKTEKIK